MDLHESRGAGGRSRAQPAVPREEDADDDDGGAIKELLFILPNGFYCASECEDVMEDDGPKEEDLFLRTY